MAKTSFTNFLILVLVFSVISMAARVDAQKRCVETLYPTGCMLNDCRKKCFEKHNSVGGQCVPTNPAQTVYECLCVFKCDG